MSDETKPEVTIEQKIRSIIAEEMGFDDNEVTLNANIEQDLNGDSLDQVEIVMRLEEEFGIEIPDEDAEKIRTVGDAVKLVDRLVAKK